jgi:hypothetical protein
MARNQNPEQLARDKVDDMLNASEPLIAELNEALAA